MMSDSLAFKGSPVAKRPTLANWFELTNIWAGQAFGVNSHQCNFLWSAARGSRLRFKAQVEPISNLCCPNNLTQVKNKWHQINETMRSY